jgi:large subunit ribosomal protein L29
MEHWEYRTWRADLRQRAGKSAQDFDNAMAEIDQRLKESRQELFNLRFQLATRQLKNHKRLRQVRHEVARLETLRRELEIEAWMREEAVA